MYILVKHVFIVRGYFTSRFFAGAQNDSNTTVQNDINKAQMTITCAYSGVKLL